MAIAVMFRTVGQGSLNHASLVAAFGPSPGRPRTDYDNVSDPVDASTSFRDVTSWPPWQSRMTSASKNPIALDIRSNRHHEDVVSTTTCSTTETHTDSRASHIHSLSTFAAGVVGDDRSAARSTPIFQLANITADEALSESPINSRSFATTAARSTIQPDPRPLRQRRTTTMSETTCPLFISSHFAMESSSIRTLLAFVDGGSFRRCLVPLIDDQAVETVMLMAAALFGPAGAYSLARAVSWSSS